MPKLLRTLFALTFVVWGCHTNASILTFGSEFIDRLDLAGTQTESEFSYFAVGAGWEIPDNVGSPPSALATFYSFTDGNVGDYVDIFLTNGGLFDFNSVDFATVLAGNSANSDEVAILGLVSGNPVEVLNITESSIPFLTIYPDFSQPIDRLRVLLTANFTDAMLFDNFNLTPTVPLPATLPLFAIAMASFAWTRRRTKTQAWRTPWETRKWGTGHGLRSRGRY